MTTAQVANKGTRRVLHCPAGCEFSADVGDYFMSSDERVFTCEHEETELCCSLVEYRHIRGKTSDGKPFYGTVRVVLAETVTVGDLRHKEF